MGHGDKQEWETSESLRRYRLFNEFIFMEIFLLQYAAVFYL